MKLNLSRRKMRRRRIVDVSPATPREPLPLRHGEPCCVAGQDWNPDGHCAWHRLHYLCDACGGWYGVPHEPGYCHSMQALLFFRGRRQLGPGVTRPDPGNCACAYCKIAAREGLNAADEHFRKLVAR